MVNKKNLSTGANAFIAVMVMAGIWCSAAAGAADWRPYAGDHYFSYFYDAGRTAYPYKTVYTVLNLELSKLNIISVWTKRIIRDQKGREMQIQEQKKLGFTTRGYERYEYTVSKKELNCYEKKYRLLSEADCTKDGDVLRLFVNDAPHIDWKPMPRDSDAEALYKALCGKTKDRKGDQPDLQKKTE